MRLANSDRERRRRNAAAPSQWGPVGRQICFRRIPQEKHGEIVPPLECSRFFFSSGRVVSQSTLSFRSYYVVIDMRC
jgi:hypothetical protein